MINLKYIAILVVGLNLGMGSGASIQEKENDVIVESEIVSKNVMYGFEDVENEEDVYKLNDFENDSILTLPLKAIETNELFMGEKVFVLSDGGGWFLISTDKNLVDGENYLVEYGRYSNKIFTIEKSDFEFTFQESYWDNPENVKDEMNEGLKEYKSNFTGL